MATVYINLSDLNDFQMNIMKFITLWVHQKKTPVPRSEVIKAMQAKGVGMPTTRNALYSLIGKGYIREAATISNKTSYVQLKTI